MAKIILIPGIGANHLLFKKQLEQFPEAQVPSWLPPLPKESLANYAKRFSAQFNQGPYLLVGMSFGGMMALELSRHIDTKGVLLIASAWSPKAIPRKLRFIERIARPIPDSFFDYIFKNFGPVVVAKRQKIQKEDYELIEKMSRQLDLSFIRWASSAAVKWNGMSLDHLPFPVTAIHGTRDPVLLYVDAPWVQPIQEGRHILPLTHPDLINDTISKML